MKENQIPTAKDFWNTACKTDELKSPADIMNEYAKLHVEQALLKVHSSLSSDSHIYQLMLNLYPLENIK